MSSDCKKWSIVVLRSPKSKLGKGIACFVYDGEIVQKFKVITGSRELDPKKLGGIQPPLLWEIKEPMSFRNHPNKRRNNMTMSRIVPYFLEDAKEEYAQRTFEWEGENSYPFMGHAGSEKEGSSTGCTACIENFPAFVAFWNVVFYHAAANDYTPIQNTVDFALGNLSDLDSVENAVLEAFEEIIEKVFIGASFEEFEQQEESHTTQA